MSIMVAVPDSPEGRAALDAAATEAGRMDSDLIIVNLTLHDLDTSAVPAGLNTKMLERKGSDDRDPAEAILDELAEHPVDRLVIGLRRRSPVGKALLGSISQRLLLESPVPVLAVKTPE